MQNARVIKFADLTHADLLDCLQSIEAADVFLQFHFHAQFVDIHLIGWLSINLL
ncbi:MAG: hypothetical protein WCF77_03225 [Minisyncoccia bacterium]